GPSTLSRRSGARWPPDALDGAGQPPDSDRLCALPFGMKRACRAGDVEIGPGRPLAIIAGPCVLESREMGMAIARYLRGLCEGLGLAYIFKASFDKANRSSIKSARGPGLERGLEWLAAIRAELGVPITTD